MGIFKKFGLGKKTEMKNKIKSKVRKEKTQEKKEFIDSLKEEISGMKADEIIADKTEEDLMKEFEEETGKKAIWGGKITKNFLNWKQKKYN